MEASLLDSLRRLKTDHVDLLQLHGPPLAALEDERVLQSLEGFAARGLIGLKGISADGEIAQRAAELPFFDTLMTTYNVVTRESAPLLSKAHANGLGVLVKSPLAHHVFGGELFKLKSLSKVWYLLRVLKNYRHLLPRARSLRLAELRPGWTAAEVALKFVLSHPAVSCAVLGTTSFEHLKEDLGTTAREELPEEVLAQIRGESTP
jgi:aryl-alcohol dehydrogenase-like predicted oxidoreductase